MTWVYEVRDLLNSGHVTNFQKLPFNYDLFFQVLNSPTPNPIWVHGSERWSLFGSIKTFVIPRYRHLRASHLFILRLHRPCVHNYPFIKFSMSTSTTTASNVSPPKPASTPSSSTSAQVTIPEIPDGYTIFTENTASILLPSTDEAFLKPVQEFNPNDWYWGEDDGLPTDVTTSYMLGAHCIMFSPPCSSRSPEERRGFR